MQAHGCRGVGIYKNMKALSLHGPWAHYERQNTENEARLAKLDGEVSHWRKLAEGLQEALAMSEAERTALLQHEVPSLREENHRARAIISRMESELNSTREDGRATAQELEAQLSALKSELQRLNSDNQVLKQELAKTVQVRSSTHTKLDEARKRLGLTASEAQVFVKEFDEASRSNKLLRQEVAQLQADRSQLQQQCESRSHHCMGLITENKRLADQVVELRRQMVELDQEAWRLRQQVSAASQRQANLQSKREKAAAVSKDRPQWLGSTDQKPASSSARLASREPGPVRATAATATSQLSRNKTGHVGNVNGGRMGENSGSSSSSSGSKEAAGSTCGIQSQAAICRAASGAAKPVSASSGLHSHGTAPMSDITNNKANSSPNPSAHLCKGPEKVLNSTACQQEDVELQGGAGVRTPTVGSGNDRQQYSASGQYSDSDPFNVQVLRQALGVRSQEKGQRQLMLLTAAYGANGLGGSEQ